MAFGLALLFVAFVAGTHDHSRHEDIESIRRIAKMAASQDLSGFRHYLTMFVDEIGRL
jgi:hypothetical protein